MKKMKIRENSWIYLYWINEEKRIFLFIIKVKTNINFYFFRIQNNLINFVCIKWSKGIINILKISIYLIIELLGSDKNSINSNYLLIIEN